MMILLTVLQDGDEKEWGGGQLEATAEDMVWGQC